MFVFPVLLIWASSMISLPAFSEFLANALPQRWERVSGVLMVCVGGISALASSWDSQRWRTVGLVGAWYAVTLLLEVVGQISGGSSDLQPARDTRAIVRSQEPSYCGLNRGWHAFAASRRRHVLQATTMLTGPCFAWCPVRKHATLN